MIAVLHAYSRTNAGDGLLVDLTLDRLARAGVRSGGVAVVALDPHSFDDLPSVFGTGSADRRASAATLGSAVSAAVVTALGERAPGDTVRALRAADAYVAVGGGYLRAGSRTNKLGTAINHLPQLTIAARSGKPSIYLPQSVGPLTGWVGARVRRALSEVTEVHVRDNRSAQELHGANVHRTPDLAVLAVAERYGQIQDRAGRDGAPIVIGRALPNAPDFAVRLHALHGRLANAAWAVQAEGAEAKSDRTFYAAHGIAPTGTLGELLAARSGPVVSVRLHGAIQAILAGVPAIHLGYERKSWGAYADLGLDRWLHDARNFDPAAVADQVAELESNPTAYWAAIEASSERLLAQSQQLDESIARIVAA